MYPKRTYYLLHMSRFNGMSEMKRKTRIKHRKGITNRLLRMRNYKKLWVHRPLDGVLCYCYKWNAWNEWNELNEGYERYG